MRSGSCRRICILSHPARVSSVFESGNWIIPLVTGIYLSYWLIVSTIKQTAFPLIFFEPIRFYHNIEIDFEKHSSHRSQCHVIWLGHVKNAYHVVPMTATIVLKFAFDVQLKRRRNISCILIIEICIKKHTVRLYSLNPYLHCVKYIFKISRSD